VAKAGTISRAVVPQGHAAAQPTHAHAPAAPMLSNLFIVDELIVGAVGGSAA
jgi:hypothetical protein